jgi:Na+/melibiose symporter-like transporter
VIQSTLIMYVKYVENETNTDFTMTVLTVQIGVVIGLFLFATINYAGYIKCKKQALQGVILGLIVTSATLTFIRLNVVTELLFGIGISGSALLLQSMLPDVIDMGETHPVRNSRLEGSYYAVFSILQKISTGVAISIVNFVLSAHGYKSGQQETQPKSAIDAISNLFAVLPILLLSLSFIPLYYYNVTSTEQRKAQNSRFIINSTNTEWIRVNDSDEPI